MQRPISKERTTTQKGDAQSTKPKAPAEPPLWVRATGRRKTRIKKARFYLGKAAWAPSTVEDLQKALLVITCNLRLYHQLPIDLSVALVMELFNPRCRDQEGNPNQLTPQEVAAKYQQAGAAGMFPTLGVSDPKAKQKIVVQDLEKEVKKFIKKFTEAGGCCPPSDLREAFIAFRGGVEINPTAFGRAVFAATGIRTSTPFGKRVYRGFHILETGSGFAKFLVSQGEAA